MRKLIKITLCIALVLSMVTGCTVVNVAKAGEVNGERIALSEYKYLLSFSQIYFGAMDYDDLLTTVLMYDSYTRSYMYSDLAEFVSEAGNAEGESSLWEKEMDGETVEEKLKSFVFDKAVELKLAAQKAAELGIELTDEEASAITDSKNSFIQAFGSQSKLSEALESVKMTESELTSMWKSMLLASKVSEALAGDDEATDEELKKYYNDNYMRVKHILVKVGDDGIEELSDAEAKAKSIIEELNGGADFEKLMSEYSSDVDSEGNINGGNTGYVFTEGDFGNPAFENASRALSVGEYTTEPVLVDGSYSGYHIIKRYALDETYFDNDEDSVKDAVKTAMQNAAYEAAINEMKESAEISRSESKIKRIKLVEIKSDNEDEE